MTMPDEKQPSPQPAAEPAAVELKKLKEISLPTAALALDATPDGRTIFAACQDGGVFAVEAEKGTMALLAQHESYASGVALLPDGKTLITAGYDGVLQWHQWPKQAPIRQVKAHDFWSWDMAVAANGSVVASVTGRYDAGGYRYEPAPEREPSVKIYDAHSGQLRREFSHVPPVQAVAISPNAQFVAAGNLMGEVRVWDLDSGQEISKWTTTDLTSWGVIKSHHYLGGVFAMMFHPEGEELFVCGMGPMVDPMAGNGTQRWQRFAWREGKKLDETHEGESGQGLMEALAFHPSRQFFTMAGRLFQGQWNLACFDAASGRKLFSTDAKHRITDALFTADGSRLLLGKAKGQEKKKDGKYPHYGLIEIHEVKRG
jgi:WD40 repeat protein